MRTARLLLLTILSAGMASGALYGAAAAQTDARPADAGRQAPTKAADVHRAARDGSEKGLPGKLPAPEPNRTTAAAKDQAVRAAANPANVHSASATQSAAARSAPSMQNEAIYRALPVRPGSAMQPASPSGNVRHRDPNAPVIGGTAIPNKRNTASLDGTRINLKTPRN